MRAAASVLPQSITNLSAEDAEEVLARLSDVAWLAAYVYAHFCQFVMDFVHAKQGLFVDTEKESFELRQWARGPLQELAYSEAGGAADWYVGVYLLPSLPSSDPYTQLVEYGPGDEYDVCDDGMDASGAVAGLQLTGDD